MAKKYYSDQKMMSQNGGMIHDDLSAPCNLPREVMDKEWAANPSYSTGYIKEDLYRGSQQQLTGDAADIRKISKPGKY